MVDPEAPPPPPTTAAYDSIGVVAAAAATHPFDEDVKKVPSLTVPLDPTDVATATATASAPTSGDDGDGDGDGGDGNDGGGYHSLPESGDALHVGLQRQRIRNNVVPPPTEMEDGLLPPLEQETAAAASASPLSFLSFWRTSTAAAATNNNDNDNNNDNGMPFLHGTTPNGRRQFVQACYLGVAAVLGTLVRMVLAQLFGEGCRNPGTVGWLAEDAVLCVTASGETSTAGDGIVFADLPANVLGCFVMGLLQDGASLGLAVHSPLGLLKPSHALQGYDMWHTALKTGFCGSLTTLSGWNSEMVVMILGNTNAHRPSQVWKALFGYLVGLETALGSYVFGRSVAFWYHQWRNPYLRAEEKATAVRVAQGMAVNPHLPAVERRFLHDLDLPAHTTERNRHQIPNLVETPALVALGRWRASTKEARRVEHVELSQQLIALETAVLADQQPITAEVHDLARKSGWDLESLQTWARSPYKYDGQPYAMMQDESELSVSLAGNGSAAAGAYSHLTASGVYKTMSETTSVWYAVPTALSMLVGLLLLLAFLIVYVWTDMTNSYQVTYRTMAYAMLFSTPGALLRWKLGTWYNGKLPIANWAWFPLGTLLANAIGAMVSMSMIGWEYNLQMAEVSGFWTIATVRAIKIGFSGCLTTVSTFAAEVHKLSYLRQGRGYKYAIITLFLCCCLAMVLYAVIV